LEELRDRLAADLDACQSARDTASLAARLSETVKQLESLPKAVDVSTPLAQLNAKRAAVARRADLAT
jgi:hypothetical protein